MKLLTKQYLRLGGNGYGGFSMSLWRMWISIFLEIIINLAIKTKLNSFGYQIQIQSTYFMAIWVYCLLVLHFYGLILSLKDVGCPCLGGMTFENDERFSIGGLFSISITKRESESRQLWLQAIFVWKICHIVFVF